MARHTVCPQPVGTQTSYIAWNDAEHAAVVAAPAVSPFKPGTPSDREWVRRFNGARQCLRISGFTQMGLREVVGAGQRLTTTQAIDFARRDFATVGADA